MSTLSFTRTAPLPLNLSLCPPSLGTVVLELMWRDPIEMQTDRRLFFNDKQNTTNHWSNVTQLAYRRTSSRARPCMLCATVFTSRLFIAFCFSDNKINLREPKHNTMVSCCYWFYQIVQLSVPIQHLRSHSHSHFIHADDLCVPAKAFNTIGYWLRYSVRYACEFLPHFLYIAWLVCYMRAYNARFWQRQTAGRPAGRQLELIS